jgi:hypothetical protein
MDVDKYFPKTKALSGIRYEPSVQRLAQALTYDFQNIATYIHTLPLTSFGGDMTAHTLPVLLDDLKYAIFAKIYQNGPRTKPEIVPLLI